MGALRAEPRIAEAFRTGAGIGWHEHDDDVFVGCEMFFRPGYLAHLTTSWIPALEGVHAKLTAGARVADVGCGLGASTVLLAQAYPASTFSGSDYHQGSIDLARKRAAEAGVAGRISFEVASAQTFAGTRYDLVTSFDCLHDMGDPVGAARHVLETLGDDGTWLIVEPFAGDTTVENLTPGRPDLLLLLQLPLPAQRPLPARRSLPRRPGRGERDPRGRGAGRLHPIPPRHGDTLQPGAGSPTMSPTSLPR